MKSYKLSLASLGYVRRIKASFFSLLCLSLMIGFSSVSAQTLYVPTGVAGIGSALVNNTGINLNIPRAELHISQSGNPVSASLAGQDVVMMSRQGGAAGFTGLTSGISPFHRPVFKGTRVRGDLTNPTPALNNDYVFSVLGTTYDGSTTQGCAAIDIFMDDNGAPNYAPMRIALSTSATDKNNRVERLIVGSNGQITATDLAGVGDRIVMADANGTLFAGLAPGADDDWAYSSGSGDAGDIYHTGAVSVGTMSAPYDFNVNGTAEFTGGSSYTLRADWTGGSLGSAILAQNNGPAGDALQALNGGSGRSAIFARGSAGTDAAIYTLGNGATHSIYAEGTGYFVDDLGVGTGTPDNVLHAAADNSDTSAVEGVFVDVQNTNNSTYVQSGIRFKNGTTANTTGGAIFYEDVESWGRGDMIFANKDHLNQVTANDGRMIIKNDGRVSIGDMTPGAGHFATIRQSGNDHNINLYNYNDHQGSSTKYGLYNYVSAAGDTNTSRYGIYNYVSGNSSQHTGTKYGLYNYLSSSKSGSKYGVYSYVSSSGSGTHYGGYFSAYGDNNRAIYATNSHSQGFAGAFYGNVFIGTATPVVATGYKLMVDGGIACEEVLVEDKGSWPDYVFEADYDLMPIEEVEQHIQEKKHLPGVPSAAEITENGGVKLGEMQRITMEKVEELTLYLIELKKQNDDLKAQNENLEQRLQQLENK